MEWGLLSVPDTSSLHLLHSPFLPLLHMESLPRDAILPELILSGLPTGSNFSRTAQTWVPHEQQLLPSHLLLRGLISMGYRSGPESAPAGVFHRPQPPSVQELQHGPPWAAAPARSPAPPRSSPQATGGLLQCLKHLSPSFLTDLGICKAISHSSLSSSCCSPTFFFSPFLNLLSQRHKQHHLLA